MCYAGETVDGWFPQRAINEQGVMMADESEGDDAYSFEDARMNEDAAP